MQRCVCMISRMCRHMYSMCAIYTDVHKHVCAYGRRLFTYYNIFSNGDVKLGHQAAAVSESDNAWLGNECQPNKTCNVCNQCCHSYISDGAACDECVKQQCPKKNECQPNKTCNVCDQCCHSYIADGEACDECVKQQCGAPTPPPRPPTPPTPPTPPSPHTCLNGKQEQMQWYNSSLNWCNTMNVVGLGGICDLGSHTNGFRGGNQAFDFAQNLNTLYTTYELEILNPQSLSELPKVEEVKLALYFSGHQLADYQPSQLHPACLQDAQQAKCIPGTFGPCRRTQPNLETPDQFECTQLLKATPSRVCPAGFVDCMSQSSQSQLFAVHAK